MSFKPTFLIFLLWLSGLGAAAQFAKFAVPFAYVRALYPDAGSEIGWLLTLISALGALLGMTAGVLVARFGLGRAVILAMILGGGISLWQATLPGMNLMLASRLIEGISHLLIVVAAPTLIAQISPEPYRGIAMTLWSTFFGVSFALVAWLGLPLVEARGLDDLLMVHGFFMLGVGGVLIVFIGQAGISKPEATSPLSVPFILRQHVDAYKLPGVVAPAVGWLSYTMTFVSLLAVLPDHLPDAVRVTIVGMMPIVSIIVSLVVVSAMLAVCSAVTTIIVGFILSALVVLTYFAGLPFPYICIALFAALGLVQGATFAAVPELNKSNESRALANGGIAQMGNLGNLLGTPILLAILGYTGLSGMLMTVAGIYIAGGLVHVFFSRTRALSQ